MEYGILLFYVMLTDILFFEGNILLFGVILFSVVMVRSVYPRFRYDFMMSLFWYTFLPISSIYLFYLCFVN